jgi:hypothetical protein
MALEQSDFTVSESEIAALNAAVAKASEEYHAASPDADPLDEMSVTFNFVPGFGRTIELRIAGQTIDID